MFEFLEGAQRPCLWWSGGKESQLLLHLARQIRPDIEIIWFRGPVNGRQQRFINSEIIRQGLMVLAVSPGRRFVLADESDHVILVDQINLTGGIFPIVRDVEHSDDECVLLLSPERSTVLDYPFDVTLTGWRDADHHPIFGGRIPYPPDGTEIAGSRFYAPLRAMTDDEVWKEIERNGVVVDRERYEGNPEADPDTIRACTKCLTTSDSEVFCPDTKHMIPAVKWDRAGSLQRFIQLCAG